MDPREILSRLSEKYENCQSYSDCGVADFLDIGQSNERILFRTTFARPDGFQFEWQDHGPCRGKSENFSILCSMHGVTCTLNRWGLEKKRNLAESISGAAGCSAGAAHYVPALLMHEILDESRHWLKLSGLRLIGSELINQTECYVVRGRWFNNDDCTLWVSMTDDTLRRVRREVYFSAEETILHPERKMVMMYSFSDVYFDQVTGSEQFACPDPECKTHRTRMIA
jgi:hypothetical protein